MVKPLKLHIQNGDQPQSCYRFRYATEGQSGAILTSVSSSKSNRRFPIVRVMNYTGWLRVRCSCVTSDPPHSPHPFRLAGVNCKDGVFQEDKQIMRGDGEVQLRNVGVQCVKLRDLSSKEVLRKALAERKKRDINPFSAPWEGFDVKRDGHTLRLCFEAFPITRKGGEPVRNAQCADPITTTVLHGKMTSDDLKIVLLSLSSAPVTGNRPLIILCSKVQSTDVQVRFFEERTKWSRIINLSPSDVHKQSAIITHVPPYLSSSITEPVKVEVQLIRPSSGEESSALPFSYVPAGVGNVRFANSFIGSSPDTTQHMRTDVIMSDPCIADELLRPDNPVSASEYSSPSSPATPLPASKRKARTKRNTPQMELLMKREIKKRLKNRIHAMSRSRASVNDDPSELDNSDESDKDEDSDYEIDTDAANDIPVPKAESLYGSAGFLPSSTDFSHPQIGSFALSLVGVADFSDDTGSTNYVTTLSNSYTQSSLNSASMFVSNTHQEPSLRSLLNSDDISGPTLSEGALIVPVSGAPWLVGVATSNSQQSPQDTTNTLQAIGVSVAQSISFSTVPYSVVSLVSSSGCSSLADSTVVTDI